MKYIDDEIRRIKSEVLKLHDKAERAVKLCFISMKGDKSVVREIARLEQDSDELDAKIHDYCSIFILRYQPFAKDLRFALGIMRISSIYERIIDLAQEVALYECEFRDKIFEAEEPLVEMFRTLRENYDSENVDKEKMIALDNIVDQIYIELMEEIEKDFRCVEEVLVTRHIERIGDLLLKVATRLYYVYKGKWIWIK
ncbi:MAG: hypothetical protein N3D19_04995 [Archaeoglobaceae archaeon]|nr:hypothetical protein [Archaeoglobaceae archaeon]